MTYEEAICVLVKIQYENAKSAVKEMDIHILPLFTRVDIRHKPNGSVRTVTIERTSNFLERLADIACYMKVSYDDV